MDSRLGRRCSSASATASPTPRAARARADPPQLRRRPQRAPRIPRRRGAEPGRLAPAVRPLLRLRRRRPDARARPPRARGQPAPRRARARPARGAAAVGEGEARGGGARAPSILADAVEALIGAVFIDGGFEAAQALVHRLFGETIDVDRPPKLAKDAKTELQEWLQARRVPVPSLPHRRHPRPGARADLRGRVRRAGAQLARDRRGPVAPRRRAGGGAPHARRRCSASDEPGSPLQVLMTADRGVAEDAVARRRRGAAAWSPSSAGRTSASRRC